MNDDQKIGFYSKIFFEFILCCIGVWHLISLANFNQLIIGKNPFEVVAFQNGMALYYFIISFILMVAAIAITWWTLRTATKYSDVPNFWILFGICLVLNLILVILEVKFISLPIFKAILITSFFAIGFLFVVGQTD